MAKQYSPDWHWYIAEVKNNTERSTFKRLSDRIAGIEHPSYEVWLPLKEKTTIRANGRKVTTQVPCFKGFLFIHCTDEKRLEIIRLEPNIKSYFIAPSTPQHGTKRIPYTMPDKAMEEYMQFVEGADDEYVVENPYQILK